MKTASDIKAVLYKSDDINSRLTEKFLRLKGPGFYSFADDAGLDLLIESMKKKGFGSKEVVILKPWKGRFFQMCPGSQNVICCNYRVLNTCFNCLYNCTYCFLNSYLNSFGIMQFTNTGDLLKELEQFLSNSEKSRLYRIGSGEFTDSLMIDEITGIGKSLIELCGGFGNVMLELKTKSANIRHLLDISNKGNAVLAWSLNTERNILLYEENTASLEERLEAAKLASDAGYFLAFHFDPIIIYDAWQQDYKELIERLFASVNPDKVVWISLGGFRYTPSFRDIMREKFPEEELTLEEMFPGIDGKYRYLKHKRIDIYKTMDSYIRDFAEKTFIYMCMESQDVWESVFGRSYDSSDSLEADFGSYIQNTFLK